MPMNTMIRKKRKELGLTQEQVAEYLGVSTPAVSKWESGATCPDITLLPALARLLRTDPGTLLCFEDEPSEQEIAVFCSEVARILEKNGYTEGLAKSSQFMQQKIQEYPRCASMIHTFALTLDGALLMSTLSPEKKKPYEDLVLSWYQRVLEGDDEKLRIRSAYMLASRYMRQEAYEKAQEMIDLLPKCDPLDKQMIQADLYLMQKTHLPEAEKLTQKKLLATAMELSSILNRLVKICAADGQMEKADRIARISEYAAEALGLGEYFSCISPLDAALAKKDVKESIRLIRVLLEASGHLWEVGDCPLYDRIADSLSAGAQTSARILPPLISSLDKAPEYEFLRNNEEFQALLAHYQAESFTSSP